MNFDDIKKSITPEMMTKLQAVMQSKEGRELIKKIKSADKSELLKILGQKGIGEKELKELANKKEISEWIKKMNGGY